MLMDLGYISDTEEWQKSAGFGGVLQQAISNSLKCGWSIVQRGWNRTVEYHCSGPEILPLLRKEAPAKSIG
jgi:hypothetical protein